MSYFRYYCSNCPRLFILSFQLKTKFLLDKTRSINLNVRMTHSLLSQLLGRYIYESRVEKNIKQSHLAAELGFSRQFMNQVENGEVAIPRDVLMKCVRFLGLSPKRLKLIFRLSSDNEVEELMAEIKSKSGAPGVKSIKASSCGDRYE